MARLRRATGLPPLAKIQPGRRVNCSQVFKHRFNPSLVLGRIDEVCGVNVYADNGSEPHVSTQQSIRRTAADAARG